MRFAASDGDLIVAIEVPDALVPDGKSVRTGGKVGNLKSSLAISNGSIGMIEY